MRGAWPGPWRRQTETLAPLLEETKVLHREEREDPDSPCWCAVGRDLARPLQDAGLSGPSMSQLEVVGQQGAQAQLAQPERDMQGSWPWRRGSGPPDPHLHQQGGVCTPAGAPPRPLETIAGTF